MGNRLTNLFANLLKMFGRVVGVVALVGVLPHVAAQPDPIAAVNAQVAAISKEIEAGKFPHLSITHESREPTEGIPPAFKYFFDLRDGKLRACEITVGHETWSKTYWYHFDPQERPLKYRESVFGRPDKPEPLALIYGANGNVVWRNAERPRVSPQEILGQYRQLMRLTKAFGGY